MTYRLDSPCPVAARFDLPHLAFHEDAEKRARRGEAQALCGACQRYVWPDQQRACSAFSAAEIPRWTPAESAAQTRRIAASINEPDGNPRVTVEDRIVDALDFDISDRRGLKWEWAEIAPDVKAKVLETWREIIRQEVAASGGAPWVAPTEAGR